MKRVLVASTALALGISGAGWAQAAGGAPVEKVNGGGQVLLDSQGQGAGDTVAFVAQTLEDGTARGQFQYVDRSGGDAGTNIHGVVDCLRVEGNRAIIVGTVTRGGEGQFRVDLADNGQQGTDLVTVTYPDDESTCDDDIEADDETTLARGNVTIHDQEESEES